MIAQGSPSCYDSAMRNLVVLFIHFIATLAWLLGPGGVGSIVAKSLLLRHQLLIVNRSRQRSPNLSAWGRILAGLDGALVASNSFAPFRNCTEALDTARPSLSHEQAKVPDVFLTESPTEARPGRIQRRTPSCAHCHRVNSPRHRKTKKCIQFDFSRKIFSLYTQPGVPTC